MPKIKQLSPLEAQKIAAGQVVDRPANVVKELIENSIDAGSTRIEIYIEDAGQKLMRISDNGCGMAPEDAQLAFSRHATSKLTSVNELPTIGTFGFRGEALGSIAAVSTVTLITREEHAQEATKIVRYEEQNAVEQTHRAPGTDIFVENLFYNIPARKKFLKKPLTEWRQIQTLVQAFCLSYPGIHFKLYNDDKLVYNCPPAPSTHERLAAVWEDNLTRNSIQIPLTTHNGMSVQGVITNHHYYRYDKNSIFLFVNNRWVKNADLARALTKGYMSVLPAMRYPAAALIITVDPHEVDVNMHPRKEEVKFLHPHTVENFITATVKQTLEQNLYPSTLHYDATSFPLAPKTYIEPTMHREYAYQTPEMPALRPVNFNANAVKPRTEYLKPAHTELVEVNERQNALESFDRLRTACPAKLYVEPGSGKIADLGNETTYEQQVAVPFAEQPTQDAPVQAEVDFTLIGQLHTTYILLEQHDGLFIIDQHAAHERIMYEQFKQERFAGVPTITLLFPVMVELTPEQITTVEPFLPLLQEHGLVVEQFGATTLMVKAAPINVKHIAFAELIKEIIAEINGTDAVNKTELTKALHEKILAQMACKAAVKAGDTLTHEHMHSLVKKLYTTENRLTCPHGRPTGWSISLYDIEKKFKRKL